MALYFFHLCDGFETLIDPDGRDILDPSLIGDAALKEARAMIAQDALGGHIKLDQRIEVRDESCKLIHQLSFRDAVTISGGADNHTG